MNLTDKMLSKKCKTEEYSQFECINIKFRKGQNWDFLGGPVVKTSPSNVGGAGLIPGRVAKIPHALGPKNQNIKQKQYCNKFNEDFKNGPHQKILKKKRQNYTV